jgi:hypothetical protein
MFCADILYSLMIPITWLSRYSLPFVRKEKKMRLNQIIRLAKNLPIKLMLTSILPKDYLIME